MSDPSSHNAPLSQLKLSCFVHSEVRRDVGFNDRAPRDVPFNDRPPRDLGYNDRPPRDLGYNDRFPPRRDEYPNRSYGRDNFAVRTQPSRQQHEKAPPSQVLGVFGLSVQTRETDLDFEFSKFGTVESVNIVYDQRVSKSLPFSVLYLSKTDAVPWMLPRPNDLEDSDSFACQAQRKRKSVLKASTGWNFKVDGFESTSPPLTGHTTRLLVLTWANDDLLVSHLAAFSPWEAYDS